MLICVDMVSGTGCGAQNRDGAQRCAQCGRPLRFPLRLHNPGDIVGHYCIGRVLGHGGFGAVYEAQDTRTGNAVAIKETLDPDSIRNFQREFALLQNLHHPNLPRYFEMFEEQGNGYLVMELVPGQSLEDVLDKQPGQPLLESQVMGYAIQLCDALTYLHNQTPPILHRDIKPANIRLTPEGVVKLVDFGLVKQGTGTTGSSRRGLTPAYAPIEQWGNLAGQHTGAYSDVYALGATLYHLLTGHAPLPATDRISVPTDPLAPVNVVNPRVSAPMANAITRAMELFPQTRCANTEAFKQMVLGSVSLAPPQKLNQYPQINIKVVAGILTSVLALCVMGSGIVFVLSNLAPQPTPALVRATSAATSFNPTIVAVSTVPVDMLTKQPTIITRIPSPIAIATPSLAIGTTKVPTIAKAPITGTFAKLWRSYSVELGGPLPDYGSPRSFPGGTFAEMPFEHGHMFFTWEPSPQVWVTFEGGTGSWQGEGTWQSFPVNWKIGDNDYACEKVADYPRQPVGSFGFVWCNMPNIRNKLGWGLSSARDFQRESTIPGIYLLQIFEKGMIFQDSDGFTNKLAYIFFDSGKFRRETY